MSIAFLDFDGTLLRRDSGVICARPSIREGLVGPRAAARLLGTFFLHKLGLRSRRDVQRAGFACYAGRSLDELRAIMQRLHDHHLTPWLSRPVLARVEEHRRAGERLVILTASAFFFAEPLGRALSLDVIGTRVGFSEGICTGLVDGEILDGTEKREAARAYAEGHGVDLAACAFYSDHIADLPLLEAVGRPVAVGPVRALARVARARGWPILEHDG